MRSTGIILFPAAFALIGCGGAGLNLPSKAPDLTTEDFYYRKVTVRPARDVEETLTTVEDVKPPEHFVATCGDDKVCKTAIDDSIYPHLSVIAVGAGSTDVSMTYHLRGPDKSERQYKMKVRFETAKPRDDLAVDHALGGGDVAFAKVPAAFTAAAKGAKARCRRSSDGASGWFLAAKDAVRFSCDVPREVEPGKVRYCTGECRKWADEKVSPTFGLCVRTSGDKVAGFSVVVKEGSALTVADKGGDTGSSCALAAVAKDEFSLIFDVERRQELVAAAWNDFHTERQRRELEVR